MAPFAPGTVPPGTGKAGARPGFGGQQLGTKGTASRGRASRLPNPAGHRGGGQASGEAPAAAAGGRSGQSNGSGGLRARKEEASSHVQPSRSLAPARALAGVTGAGARQHSPPGAFCATSVRYSDERLHKKRAPCPLPPLLQPLPPQQLLSCTFTNRSKDSFKI